MPGLRAAALAQSASAVRYLSAGRQHLATPSNVFAGGSLHYICHHSAIKPTAPKQEKPAELLLKPLHQRFPLQGPWPAALCRQQLDHSSQITITRRTYQMAADASNSAASTSTGEADEICFGPYKIRASEQVFFESKLSCALVNLKPIVPGHVLIIPKQVVRRFADLTSEQVADLWLTAQKVGNQLEKFFKASSLTYAIQDGPQAGQTVPHVHIHVLPRKEGDFENNDEIYNEIDKGEKGLSDKLRVDSERRPRSSDEMAKEASVLRSLFN
ncbi:Fragile Histidine Triad (FHIT) protein [Klebsormidium nitens]|uniref:Fragile Histidine Triad (FHIT) protein n=1 Tax=Klebsormidium nitens TaxID=105231 RepID=A0A1Y1IC34_KLENI|nr:Fragile Histidine Triad (FHIT) protein [Klebsormidium nitens]|eukprot:GAQ85648.1 Fragile Histidine Triad (FHIT) protein [Klebsormidium nitens]